MPSIPRGQLVDQIPKESELQLPWEYCECGCKTFTIHLGEREYSLYIMHPKHEIHSERYLLFGGHGAGSLSRELGAYRTAREVELKVKEHALQHVIDVHHNSEKAMRALNALDDAGV